MRTTLKPHPVRTPKYRAGLMHGRFQLLTDAHMRNIIEMDSMCDLNVINVGSIDQAPDLRNFLTFAERRDMIRAALPQQVSERTVIVGQRDLGNRYRWAAQSGAKMSAVLREHGIDPDTAAIGLFGHRKDPTSFYLDDFPGYEFENQEPIADPRPGVPEGRLLSASDIRAQLFDLDPSTSSEAWFEEIEPLLAPGVTDFLRGYIRTQTYARLVEENRRAKAAAAPWRVRETKDGPGVPHAVNFNAVDPVIVQGNAVLMVQRDSYPGKGNWALPGGMLGTDEDVITSAIRHAIAKTSIDMTSTALRAAMVDTWYMDSTTRSIRDRTISFPVLFHLQPTPKGSTAVQRRRSMAFPRVAATGRCGFKTFEEIERMRPLIHEDHAIIIDQALERLGTRKGF
jgi:bifunctional NMN adenylyltransferase/nudix hydrolase